MYIINADSRMIYEAHVNLFTEIFLIISSKLQKFKLDTKNNKQLQSQTILECLR